MQEILEYLNKRKIYITCDVKNIFTFKDSKYVYTVQYDDDAEVYMICKDYLNGIPCSPMIYRDTPKELIEFMESVL